MNIISQRQPINIITYKEIMDDISEMASQYLNMIIFSIILIYISISQTQPINIITFKANIKEQIKVSMDHACCLLHLSVTDRHQQAMEK